MRIKRTLGGLLAVVLICTLPGCAPAGKTSRPGTAEHEVLTLAPVAEDKQLITMRSTDGVQIKNIEEGIERRFPNVDIVVVPNSWLRNDMANNNHEDIVLVANSIQVEWDARGSLIDLSSESYLQNYYLSALQNNTEDGSLYYLPGPSNIYGVVYNKDMFAQYGWEVPSGLDEFIALCQSIEETGIRAVQPALYYKDAGRQFFTAFTYEPVFAGVENSVWYDDYRSGAAVMAGHMEPAFEIMQRFIDADILREGDYEVKPRERSGMMYTEQSCAMILETQDAVNYGKSIGGEDGPELGMMPFFSGNGEDSDYLLAVPKYFIGANAALEEPGNEEKLQTVKDILAFISSVEGQRAITPPDSTMISSIRGMEWNNSTFLSDVTDTIEKGHVVNQPFFVGESNTAVDEVLKEDMLLFVKGEITPRQMMADLDAARDSVLEGDASPVKNEVIGTVEETFTVLQTAQLFADIFRKRADAQIGLCMANTKDQGCNYRLYQGELILDDASSNALKDVIQEGFINTKVDENGQKLMRLTLTGENLIKTLNDVYVLSGTYPDRYWTASGLRITFAPWAGEGQRIVSVTLADGSEIKPDEVYTVAAWNGTIDPEMILEVEEYYEDNIVELFSQRVEAEGPLKPMLDEYFILDWDTIGEQ